jgi:hypothetical protein
MLLLVADASVLLLGAGALLLPSMRRSEPHVLFKLE